MIMGSDYEIHYANYATYTEMQAMASMVDYATDYMLYKWEIEGGRYVLHYYVRKKRKRVKNK